LGFGPEYDERAYLKREVRGRRVARSLSERCPAILRCADGIPSKSVANGFIPPCQLALADRPPESDMLTVFAAMTRSPSNSIYTSVQSIFYELA
jgi:hypothetical protein